MRVRWTGPLFIERSKLIHGDKYDYCNVVYCEFKSKVEIICKKHGLFFQSPMDHLRGCGCPICKKETIKSKQYEKNKLKNSSGNTKVIDLDTFLNKAKSIHGDTYDYSMSKYIGINSKITIGCKYHGNVEISTYWHLKGSGCKYCSIQKSKIKMSETKKDLGYVVDTDSFILESLKIHGDKFNYSKVDYVASKTPVIIICKDHGEFEQAPDKHLSGHSCYKCNIIQSKLEIAANKIIDSLGLKYERQKKFTLDGKTLEIDMFFEEFKIGIEINGTYTHSSGNNCSPNYHLYKREFFNKLGIRVIFIWEDEIKYKKELIISYLSNVFLKNNNRVWARKCKIETIKNSRAMEFLDENHLLGRSGNNSLNLGLSNNNGKLLAVMCFNKSYGKWTLTRMANLKGFNVVGGFSKLLNYWRDLYSSETLISFIDLDKFIGDTYFNCGFVKEGVSKTLWYMKRDKRYSKFNFRHSKLKEVLKNYNPNLSEKENCHSHNIYQTWNSGTMRVKLIPLGL